MTLGTSFKITNEKHIEDTAPLFLGRTFGVRQYYQKEKPVVIYKYYDTQISFLLGGKGIGKLINSKGETFKKINIGWEQWGYWHMIKYFLMTKWKNIMVFLEYYLFLLF